MFVTQEGETVHFEGGVRGWYREEDVPGKSRTIVETSQLFVDAHKKGEESQNTNKIFHKLCDARGSETSLAFSQAGWEAMKKAGQHTIEWRL